MFYLRYLLQPQQDVGVGFLVDVLSKNSMQNIALFKIHGDGTMRLSGMPAKVPQSAMLVEVR